VPGGHELHGKQNCKTVSLVECNTSAMINGQKDTFSRAQWQIQCEFSVTNNIK